MPAMLALAISVHSINAQESAAGEAGLCAPTAAERAKAREKLGDKALTVYRKALKEGAPPGVLVDALIEVGRKRTGPDIPLIARHVSSLEPGVASTAVEVLKSYGRAGLKAVQALDASLIDAKTRKQVTDLLLMDHVRNSCRRDRSINPYLLDYESRFDELYSVEQPIDDLLLKLLRDCLPEIRQDIDGMRYYYGGYYGGRYEEPFTSYGGLAVAALARRKPEVLEREFAELARITPSENPYYWGYNQRSPVTTEFAIFFAARSQPALAEKLVSDYESGMRWQQEGPWTAMTRMQIAALQMRALNESDAALEVLNGVVVTLGSEPNSMTALAHYLRARLLIKAGEEGEALHALEEAMESSSRPPVLVLVDSAFAPLAAEKRFRDVIRFCELRQRLMPLSLRPWHKGMNEPEPGSDEEEPSIDDNG